MTKVAAQFVKYCTVGAIGALLTSYGNLFFQSFGVSEYVDPLNAIPVPWALGFAIMFAGVSNFTLNKFWTFREKPHLEL
jgi:putative flippase GtrA